MTIPLSKAKEVCTSSEYALVSASRAPKLNKLSPEQSQGLAGRARRAIDKWQDLSRAQGRARAGSAGERTRLKVELFRDALRRFEDKAASQPAAGGSKAGGKGGAARDARAKAGGSGGGRKAAVRKTRAKPGTPEASAKQHRPPLKWVEVLSGAKFPGSPDKQRGTRPRAKEFRAGEVGMTTRARGHAAAAGKRAQGRRGRKGSQAGW